MIIAELAASHAYLARALYPPEQQQRARESLAFVVGELLPAAERVPWRPRPPELDRRVRKLQQRYVSGISAAHVATQVALARWGVDTTLHRAAAHTGRLTTRQWRSRDPRGCDVIRSIWAPRRDQAYLLVPLAMARHPSRQAIYARLPHLVAPAVPPDLPRLVLDPDWPLQALQVAATWRWLLEERGLA